MILTDYELLKLTLTILFSGTSWQQTLYHAIDGTSVVVALLSPSYLASTVCTEEYNLSLAKHLSQVGDLQINNSENYNYTRKCAHTHKHIYIYIYIYI